MASQRPPRPHELHVAGPGGDHRGELGVAVERVARVDPDAVAAHADALCDSLERELAAEDAPGNDVRLDEEKTAALCRAAGEAGIEAARPLLRRLGRHHRATVSDAAREAVREL